MAFASRRLELSPAQREELEGMRRSRTLPAGDVFRARLILALAAGETYAAIERRLETNPARIRRWKKRFEERGLDGLRAEAHRGRRAGVATPRLQARVLARVRKPPGDGSTQWSCRKLAFELGTSKDTVARILRKAGLRPHRLERYMASNDPHFEEKAADIIGLYLDPPQHAAVFCLDENTAIQALDRLDPVLPMSPGRNERHGFEYRRHGTLSLYAALDVKTGKVHGRTAARHTSQEFVAFLGETVARCKPGQEIHIVLDNLSAHTTAQVAAFLEVHPRVRLHFTPTYSSWLNQVEIWFGRMERDVIARGVFRSVGDLARKLMRYIRAYANSARPIRWAYSDPSRRIRSC
jgi:transposase